MKTICIVGNSPHIKGLGLGGKIDSHDIVIRIGRFYCDPHDFGTKVTHWYIGPWALWSHSLKQNISISFLDDKIAFFNNSAGPKLLHLLGWSKMNSGWKTEDIEELLANVSKSCSDVEVVQHEGGVPMPPELLVYYPEEKNQISGVRIYPTLGARIVHHYVKNHRKVTIAGFGGDKKGVKEIAAAIAGFHDLETDYRLIDILIDAGKIENIEGTYIYR